MNNSTDGWSNIYLKTRSIEADNRLPEGSVKPLANGRFSLLLSNLTEDQIKQVSHLWYVISQTQHMTDTGQHRPHSIPVP